LRFKLGQGMGVLGDGRMAAHVDKKAERARPVWNPGGNRAGDRVSDGTNA